MDSRVTYTNEEILKALQGIRGQRYELPLSSSTVELEYASMAYITICVYNHRGDKRLADISREFWRVVLGVQEKGEYLINYSAYPFARQYKYVVVLLKQMPVIFEVTSDISTSYDIVRFANALPTITKNSPSQAASLYKEFTDTLTKEIKEKYGLKKKRVTSIVGAGAAIELGEKNGITTAYITGQILQNTEARTQALLHTIHKNIPEKYKENFEAYFYVVEQLVTYDAYWLDDKKANIPPFAPFIKPNHVKPDVKKKRVRNILLEMYMQLMETIHQYNEYFAAEIDGKLSWYTDFWRKAENLYWDVFTFNYDTTIEKALESYYIDGYKEGGENVQTFVPKRYLSEFERNDKHTINHIHGCLLYSGDEPDFSADDDIQAVYSHTQRKWKSYEDNKDFLNKILMGRGLGQSGDYLAQDCIITGLHKTDKIISHPYAFYRTQLDKQLINNNRLLIIGYSFNDYYVNNMLESIPSYHSEYKIVIVDFLSDAEYIESSEKYALGDMFNRQKEKKFLLHFVETIINKGEVKKGENVWNNFNYSTTKDKYIVSKDSQVMFFYGGFKEATRHKDVIYTFLTEESHSL